MTKEQEEQLLDDPQPAQSYAPASPNSESVETEQALEIKDAQSDSGEVSGLMERAEDSDIGSDAYMLARGFRRTTPEEAGQYGRLMWIEQCRYCDDPPELHGVQKDHYFTRRQS